MAIAAAKITQPTLTRTSSPSRVRARLTTNPAPTAPMPRQPISKPKPAAPVPSCRCPITGSSAHSAEPAAL